jgi:hypothetical protein
VTKFYTDEISLEKLQLETAFECLHISDKLQLSRMRFTCENFLCISINMENIVPMLNSSQKHKWQLLESYCYRFILQNYNQVVQLSTFETLSPSALVKIMRLQSTFLKEEVLPLVPLPVSHIVEDLKVLYKYLRHRLSSLIMIEIWIFRILN